MDLLSLEAYRYFSFLQINLELQTAKLMKQYKDCDCLGCQLNYMDCKLELQSVQCILEVIEKRICPDIKQLLQSAEISFTISKEGNINL